MDLKRFDAISEWPIPLRAVVWQDWAEWRAFLEFAWGYFKRRGIERPLVVEIGVMHNEQRHFYRELLGADHIGLDINANNVPDILGDSADPATLARLEMVLAGRKIDLLFIDGNHSAPGVKADYEMYGPLTRHLIAIHDVHAVMNRVEAVNAFWNETMPEHEHMTVVFHRYNRKPSIAENRFMNMGIGVIIKEQGHEAKPE
jgi:hypothetical protein